MKRMYLKTMGFALMLGVAATIVSFTMPSNSTPASEKAVVGNIDFRIENNTGDEYKYCVNGGHNYISKGSTKSFSYAVGQDFYHIEGSNCGKLWFKVTADMSGKTYKVTDLK